MKVFLAALLILAILIGGVIWNANYVRDFLYDLQSELTGIPLPAQDQKDLSVQLALISSLEQQWYQKSEYISVTVNHADLMEAELQFAAARGAAEAGSADNYLISISQLDYALGHLADMAGGALHNIL
jgi:hypothetical protein